MNKKLCSVLLPSRARINQCVDAVNSLLGAEPELNDKIDILLRLDRDDPQLEEYTDLFGAMPNVHIMIGERGHGFIDICFYYTELAKTTDAKWLMQWNDDATISGPWISELAKVTDDRVWVQCEIHRLGGSTYPKDDGAPFVILPNRFWEVIGLDTIPKYSDTGSINSLRALGWKCQFLPETSFHHQRADNDTIEQHRRL
jgi:hypothetical protein